MSLPVTVPFTFGNATTAQSLSSLDTNFTTITNSVNGLTNGASKINVSSITATGTANATTYLRGDGAWAAISGGGSGTVTSVDVNGGTTGLTTSGGPVTGSGNITISGTLVVANGGTGASNLTLNNVILGNNTGTVKVVAPGTTGNVLTSNGSSWISGTLTQTSKAWVNFNGTLASPITPRANYNVSSVTKNGTGDYTLNFTNALADANYSISGSCSVTSTGAGAATVVEIYDAAAGGTNPTTTALRIYVHRSGVGAVDQTYVCVNIFGN